MPDTVTPISNLAAVGLVKDVPPVALPPNAFTDTLNVRFRHNSVSKMPGEKSITYLTPLDLGVPNGEFIFITEWPNPNLGDDNTYYIMVLRDSSTSQDHVVMARALPLDLANPEHKEIGVFDAVGTWQSTLFQGGYAIILNNGFDKPQYLLDTSDGLAMSAFELKDLPGWDSYLSTEKVIDVTYDAKSGTPGFDVGELVDFTQYKLRAEAYEVDGTFRGYVDVTANGTYARNANNNSLYVITDTATNTTVLTPEYDTVASNDALLDGEQFVVYKIALTELNVRAGLIKSFGDLLIAGDLRTVDLTNLPVEQLPGMIRTSNIAAPGALPTNWNPYIAGANTADEIQLASTGIVRDMVELQNQMIIYTDRSIHALAKTGNVLSPFSVTNITNSYGAMTLDSVIEFDGKHLVIGNNDIYLFGGHPGSIQSVAENRVRDFFYADMNKEKVNQVFIFRNIAKDEIWINYPSGNAKWSNKTLIWNYKNNCFTIRKMSDVRSGFAGRAATYLSIDGGDSNTGPANTETPKDEFVSTANGGGAAENVTEVLAGDDADPFDFDSARRYPIFCDSLHVYYGEADDVYIDHEGNTYESRVARIELPISPELDVEHMKSAAFWASRKSNEEVELDMFMQTHNNPTGDEVVFDLTKKHPFIIGQDYKVDLHSKGRFFDYIITDKPTSSDEGSGLYWALSGMQVNIGKGGSR